MDTFLKKDHKIYQLLLRRHNSVRREKSVRKCWYLCLSL